MSPEQTIRIAQRLLADIGAGIAPEEIAALFNADVQFEVPGDIGALPWIGRRTGSIAVSDFIPRHALPARTHSLRRRRNHGQRRSSGNLRSPHLKGQRNWKDYRLTVCAYLADFDWQDHPLPDVGGQLYSLAGSETLKKDTAMKIVVGSDHAGFTLKQEIVERVSHLGHELQDLGAYNSEPSDYPDFAAVVGKAIMVGAAERGILICGSGVGVCVAANKMPGIRAATCHDTYSARQGVEHDDMNVLVMGSRIVGSALAFELTIAYLNARFQPSEERFLRRLSKLKEIERLYMHAV
jgi:ribose 5-phosphate isomerase B